MNARELDTGVEERIEKMTVELRRQQSLWTTKHAQLEEEVDPITYFN